MKLFKLTVTGTGKNAYKKDRYFDSKAETKFQRDVINNWEDQSGFTATLHRGPDHWKGETFMGDGHKDTKKWV